MDAAKVKENSKKFLAAIQSGVEGTLDTQKDDFKTELWQIWEEINGSPAKVFFMYFSRDDISDDGYYFKDINLDDPDSDFIGAMFTSNNLQSQ